MLPGGHGTRGIPQFGWYEAGLSVDERKRRGHFSTPYALVDQILDACGYSASADLCDLRVLDPACGSGNFLARAARHLCLSARARGLDQDQVAELARRNLWGLDPDPVACFLAEMQVRSALAIGTGCNLAAPAPHIHQVDSLALSWQPCVDLLVANPPYLATKNTDLSHYRQGEQRRGQIDSYLLFLDLALQAVRPGGWIGLVLPDPVLARSNAAPERLRLLQECTLLHLWHLSGVFAAEVGAAVLIARKVPPPSQHSVSWTRARWRSGQSLSRPEQAVQRVGQGSAKSRGQGMVDPRLNHATPVAPEAKLQRQPPIISGSLEQALLANQPGAEMRYLLGHEQGRAIERLRHALDEKRDPPARNTPHLLPLGTLVNIKRGEEIGRANTLLKPLLSLNAGLPVLRGGIDLRPYATFVTDLGIERSALKKPLDRYLRPKLLVVKSTERLQAVLDTRGHVVLQTLYLLHLREQAAGDEIMDAYYFLLAVLNSRLLRAYVYNMHTAYKLVQPQIEQGVLEHLPVPWGSARSRREIAVRARELEQACGQEDSVVEWDERITSLYEEQERALCALYAAATPGIFTDKGVVIYG